MSEFWLWFWRPMAEALGGLFMLAIFALIFCIGIIFYALYLAIMERIARRRP